MPAVEFLPDAADEAAAAREWYAARSTGAANAFLIELDHAIEQIRSGPGRWPLHVHETRRYLMHHFPFSVIYKEIGSTIYVIAVAHAKRKPGYWKDR